MEKALRVPVLTKSLSKNLNVFLVLVRWASKHGLCPFAMVPQGGASTITLIACSIERGVRAAKVLQHQFGTWQCRWPIFVPHV